MPRETITRKAAEAVYLHKDFHGALSVALEYVESRYGAEAVREYLRQFAGGYYRPLREELGRRGLAALAEHIERVYRAEGAEVRVCLSQDELLVEVPACPAVTHMRQHGYPIARLFVETTRTVNEAICQGTPYAAELLEYDESTGRSLQRFFRRTCKTTS